MWWRILALFQISSLSNPWRGLNKAENASKEIDAIHMYVSIYKMHMTWELASTIKRRSCPSGIFPLVGPGSFRDEVGQILDIFKIVEVASNSTAMILLSCCQLVSLMFILIEVVFDCIRFFIYWVLFSYNVTISWTQELQILMSSRQSSMWTRYFRYRTQTWLTFLIPRKFDFYYSSSLQDLAWS